MAKESIKRAPWNKGLSKDEQAKVMAAKTKAPRSRAKPRVVPPVAQTAITAHQQAAVVPRTRDSEAFENLVLEGLTKLGETVSGILSLLELLNKSIITIHEQVTRFEHRDRAIVRDELTRWLRRDSLSVPTAPQPPVPQPKRVQTANGVQADSDVYVVYVDESNMRASRVYQGKATAVTKEEVTVFVKEDGSEMEYPADRVFLMTSDGHQAALRKTSDLCYGQLAIDARRAELAFTLLTQKFTVSSLGLVPHRDLMSALAKFGITNFTLKDKRGDDRFKAILAQLEAVKKTDRARVLEAELRSTIKVYSEHVAGLAAPSEETATEESLVKEEAPKSKGRALKLKKAAKEEDPRGKTPVVGDFVVVEKTWYQIEQVKPNGVLLGLDRKTNERKGFKSVVFVGLTKRLKKSIWHVAPKN